MYRHNGQQKYYSRSTVTVSVEAEILATVKHLAEENRYTLSEIVGQSFIDFIHKHKQHKE
jgi:predicted transcriptional regulator